MTHQRGQASSGQSGAGGGRGGWGVGRGRGGARAVRVGGACEEAYAEGNYCETFNCRTWG